MLKKKSSRKSNLLTSQINFFYFGGLWLPRSRRRKFFFFKYKNQDSRFSCHNDEIKNKYTVLIFRNCIRSNKRKFLENICFNALNNKKKEEINKNNFKVKNKKKIKLHLFFSSYLCLLLCWGKRERESDFTHKNNNSYVWKCIIYIQQQQQQQQSFNFP